MTTEGEKKPIYEKGMFKIEYSCCGRPDVRHELWIGKRGEDGRAKVHYQLPRGVLKLLAAAPAGELEGVLNKINPNMANALRMEKFNWNDLSAALEEAYVAEEWARELRARASHAKVKRQMGIDSGPFGPNPFKKGGPYESLGPKKRY